MMTPCSGFRPLLGLGPSPWHWSLISIPVHSRMCKTLPDEAILGPFALNGDQDCSLKCDVQSSSRFLYTARCVRLSQIKVFFGPLPTHMSLSSTLTPVHQICVELSVTKILLGPSTLAWAWVLDLVEAWNWLFYIKSCTHLSLIKLCWAFDSRRASGLGSSL